MIHMKEPAWLQAQVDQVLAKVEEAAGHPIADFPTDVLMLFLTEPSADNDIACAIWEETCDRCGTHLPGGLTPGVVQRTFGKVRVQICFGLCPECKALR